MTAHYCVFVAGPVQGRTLLVTGAAGAVGHYAVQLAKWAGATVIATVSSEAKAERARAGGADHVINYRSEDVAARVRDITGGEGVDHVVDVDFGGNLAATLRCVRANGSIAIYASNGDRTPRLPVGELMQRNISLYPMSLPGTPHAGAQARTERHGELDRERPAHPVGRRAIPAVSRPRRRTRRWSAATRSAPW